MNQGGHGLGFRERPGFGSGGGGGGGGSGGGDEDSESKEDMETSNLYESRLAAAKSAFSVSDAMNIDDVTIFLFITNASDWFNDTLE